MELIYIFRILYQRKWIILICTILAIAAAFILTRNKKPIYRSTAQLSTGYTVSEDIKLSDEIFNLSQIDVKFNNVIADMTSAKVMSLLSYDLILHDFNSAKPFRKPDESALKNKPRFKKLDFAGLSKIFEDKKDSMLILNPGNPSDKNLLDILELYDYTPKSVKQRLFAGRYQRTDYIDVSFRSENAELSAFAVNTLCIDFERYYETNRRERSVESVVLLDSLLKKRKQELDDKISLRTKFLNDSVSNPLDANLVGASKLGQIGQYEASLAEENGKVQDLSYQIEQLGKQLNSIPATSTTTSPASGGNSEFLGLRRQYADLYDEYQKKGSNDPDMRKRLDDLQAKMKEKANQTPNTTSNNDVGLSNNQRSSLTQQKITAEGNLRSANSKINFYHSKLSELRSQLGNTSPRFSAKLDQMDKDVEFANLEYKNAKEKVNLAGNITDGSIHTFKQTMIAQPASEPEPSRRMIILALSGLSAFILTALVFIFLAFIDQSIKTPSQFQRQTDLKLLGSINWINLKQTSLEDQVTQIEKEDATRNNSFRELLRKLRYEIEKSGKRVILFTSTEPRQGKTTLSQALAFSLSLGKHKVLLIDTNFCNNDLTTMNSALPTLEQFSGNGQLDPNQLEHMITKTGVKNVDIIGCKGGDYTPSEILPKNHLLNYLPDLLKKYDYIFMEAAPLNGFTDTKELVQYADGIIAIFSAHAEIKQADKESIKFLSGMKDKFLGAVLNKIVKTDMNQ
jgi:polysaccharide biosynthesis transport protein